MSLANHPLYNRDMNNFGPRAGFAWDVFGKGRTVLRAGYSLGYDLPNFGAIHAPQTYFQMWSGTRAGFFSQVPEGIFSISDKHDAGGQSDYFQQRQRPQFPLCGFRVHGSRREHIWTERHTGSALQRGPGHTEFPDSDEPRLQPYGRAASKQQDVVQSRLSWERLGATCSTGAI